MRLLYTSDIHGIMSAYEAFAQELGRASYDLGVLGEDLLEGPGKPILFVLGKHDHQAWPESALLHNLHGRRLELGSWNFVGYRWAHGDRPPKALAEDLARLRPLVDRRTILVTHAPPKGILDRCRRKDPSTGRLARTGLEPLRRMRARRRTREVP